MSANANDSYVLQRLDDPWKLGLWQLDVALPFSLCLFLGMMRGTALSLTIGTMIGLFIGYRINKIKASRHQAYFRHLIYWMLPPVMSRALACPPSAQQEMVG